MENNSKPALIRILIVAAARNEVAALPPLGAFATDDNRLELTLLPDDGDCVGAVPLAVAMTQAAALNHFDYAVNLGFCGAREQSLPIGGNVLITQDTFFDYGFLRPTGFVPLSATPFPLHHTDSDGWLTATSPSLLSHAPPSLPRRRGYTVAHPSTDAPVSAFGRPFPRASVETMEGAAFAYTASALAIPALAIRTVSNYCARGDAAQWNIPKAQLGVREALSDALRIIKLDLQTH